MDHMYLPNIVTSSLVLVFDLRLSIRYRAASGSCFIRMGCCSSKEKRSSSCPTKAKNRKDPTSGKEPKREPKSVDALTKLFSKYCDAEGRLNVSGLSSALETIGLSGVSSQTFVDMIASVDKEGQGTINVEEFKLLVTQRPNDENHLPNNITFTVLNVDTTKPEPLMKAIQQQGKIYWGPPLNYSESSPVSESQPSETLSTYSQLKDEVHFYSGNATFKKSGLDFTSEESLKKIRTKILVAHNDFRQKHRSPALILSAQLSGRAQRWAVLVSRSEGSSSQSITKFGENVYMFKNYKNVKPEEAVDAWYEEERQYSYLKPGFDSETNHFTQLVWKSSRELGVGFSHESGCKEAWLICLYNPPGNVSGKYRENVEELR